MEENNRPRRREKKVTEGGTGVRKRGEGLGTGKVGSSSAGNAGQQQKTEPDRPQEERTVTRSGGGGKMLILAALAALLLGGGGGLSALLNGGGGQSNPQPAPQPAPTPSQQETQPVEIPSTGALPIVQSLFNTVSPQTSSQWSEPANTGNLNNNTANKTRDRFTKILGNGRDTVNIMVYMCGADLESRSGMATKDLMEMAQAKLSNKINLIVYTGGCKAWQINGISNSVNQIFKVENGGLRCLETNAGKGSMTNPDTLESYLKWCKSNLNSANRNILIFWDHGGGSITGFGIDEKNKSSGSMSLAQIDQALKNADMKFDFIGFDTCLMATAENALMLSKYADYMIASEETEPGVGWYYTNWLNDLSANTSISTLQVGKRIVDDFVEVCAQKCKGQKTTLSVVDLAELSQTLGDAFTAFSRDTREMIAGNEFRTVSAARNNTREFAGSAAIDQIDLIHFAKNLGTDEGTQLAKVLQSAVKYNRTGNITNAYGLSIYFPYKSLGTVDKAVATYSRIGLDEEYSQCIREFASLGASGQIASGGGGGLLSSLFGMPVQSTANQGSDDITQLLNAFLGGGMTGIPGLSSANTNFFSGRSLDVDATARYIADNHFDPAGLKWHVHDGVHKIVISQEQWDLVQDLDLNMFYDDGEGYIDLGLDNVFEFDEYGNLIGETDGTWISINSQPVAYYRMSTAEEGDAYTITGRVPVMLNGERMDLILIFTDETPDGYVAGALPVYTDVDSDAVSRGLVELAEGDKIDFLCDYYTYDGEYVDSYMLGDQMTVSGELAISNTYVGDDYLELYRFTDIYAQSYWTAPVPVE